MFDDVVTRYVRGEAREDALEDIGAILLLSSRSFDESGGRGQHVNVSLPDIAKGALRNYHDPVARHLWSIIVYHASFIEYDNESETGDFVVEILWDMAFNNPISPERVVGLQKIAESEP
jgi:hypothetical protein